MRDAGGPERGEPGRGRFLGGTGGGSDEGFGSRFERRVSWAVGRFGAAEVGRFGGAEVDDAAFHQSAGVDILNEQIGGGRKKVKVNPGQIGRHSSGMMRFVGRD